MHPFGEPGVAVTTAIEKMDRQKYFLTERIVDFLNTVQFYNILEVYCCYEIQKYRVLCEFVVEKRVIDV